MRDFQTFFARSAGAVLAVCLLGTGGPLYAQSAGGPGSGAASERIRNADPPRGGPALDRAQAAWGRGDFDVAEAQFAEALEQGGLPRKDLLKAHVYLGAARAVLGKRDRALAAFRIAATLDPSFKVPSEAGKKATLIADTARKQHGQPVALQMEAPADTSVGRPFRVEVALSGAAGSQTITRVMLAVGEGPTASYRTEQAASAHIAFDVPGRIATDGAALSVRVSGLDARGNEWVSSESNVRVESEGQGPTPLPLAAVPPPPSANEPAKSGFRVATAPAPKDNADHDSKGGFWSSPWPYIIGGAVLVGAGAGAYFLLRPSDDVTVAPVQVQAIR
ncbi:hypothetical protein LVJ94_13145 [Pendulispora rubella]|uniref:Tetratricopeptide repeat protein n=1 Tax=Pendulispora rubella TaxID=2741070 RepID=A0ABZ2LEG2_9BACT